MKHIFLIFFIFGSFCELTYAQDNQPSLQSRPAVMATLKIDRRDIGLLWVYPRTKTHPKMVIEANTFLLLLTSQLLPLQQERFRRMWESYPLLDEEIIQSHGLGLTFREEELSLSLSIPHQWRKKQKINLYHSNQSRGINVFGPAFYSGFLNVRPTYRRNYGSGVTTDNFSSNFQLVQNVGKWVLETGGTYDEQTQNFWTRDDTRIVRDYPDQMMRLSLGDLRLETTGFQTFVRGAGAAITREFNLRPYEVDRAIDQKTIILDRASQVEIYMNGVLIKKLFANPGPLSLENFPFSTGVNDVLIKTIDDRGKTSEINFSSLHHSALLPEGKHEFSYQAEAPSQNITGKINRQYNESASVGTLFHRYGLTQGLTLGLNLQADSFERVAGIESIWLSRFGLTTLHFAGGEYVKKNNGLASRIDFQSLDRWGNKRAPFTFRFSSEVRSLHFTEASLRGTQSSRPFRIETGISKRLPWNLSTGIGGAYNRFRTGDGKNDYRTQVNLAKNWGKGWQSGVNYQYIFGRTNEKRMLLTLNWSPPSSPVQVFANHDTKSETTTIQAQSDIIRGLNNLRAVGSVTNGPDQGQGAFQMEFSGQRLQARLDHTSTIPDNSSEQKTHTTSISGGFSLAHAGTSWGVGRPVQNGFALVRSVPLPEGYQLSLNRNSSYSRGTITKYGPAFINNLRPYLEENLALDVGELPDGDYLEFDYFTVIPTYKSGVEVLVPISRQLAVDFLVLDGNSRPIALQTGDLIDEKGNEIGRFFSGTEGRVFIEGLAPGHYTLRFDDTAIGELTMTLLPGSRGVISLGVFRVIKGAGP